MANTAEQLSNTYDWEQLKYTVTNSGTRKSSWQPMREDTAHWLSVASDDIDVLARNFAECKMRVNGGKRATLSRFQKQYLLHLARKVKHYSKWIAIPLSTYEMGAENNTYVGKFLHELEAMGCIRCDFAEYAYYKYAGDHSVACCYSIHPIFTQYLTSLTATATTLQGFPSYTMIKGGPSKAAMNSSNLALKAKRQRREWSLHTLKEITEQLLPHVELSCHLNISSEWSDADILKALDMKYTSLNQELHGEADLEGFESKCEYNIERDKQGFVYKIGYRPTNKLCQTKNEEHDAETRKSMVIKALGAYNHEDVKCSIYNINILMNTGKFDIDSDVYTNVGSLVGMERKDVKKCFMKANFGVFADSIHKGTRKDVKLGETTYANLQRAMQLNGLEIQGTNTSVFYYEDLVYTMATSLMKNDGIKCIRVFDSFYTDVKISRKKLEWYILEAFYSLRKFHRI